VVFAALDKTMKKQLINEVKQLQKIAGILGLLKEGQMSYPYKDTNIFLSKKYIKQLDSLVQSILWGKGNFGADPILSKAIYNFVEVLETGWRDYDDTFDGDFDGDDANMNILDAQIRSDYDGKTTSYEEAKSQLDTMHPGLSEEIEDLFMEGKREYYEDVNELHPDKEWDEEEDEEEPYQNDMDNLDTSLPKV